MLYFHSLCNRSLWAYYLLVWTYTIIYCKADFMDLVSESICAAQCLKLFTDKLTGEDKLFLQQRPDLTQPHCINQKEECSMCLDVCRWSRSQINDCQASCKVISSVPIQDKTVESRCMTVCHQAQTIYLRSDQFRKGLLPAFCPNSNSWPQTCRHSCLNDQDCSHLGLSKCCETSLCHLNSRKPPNLPPSSSTPDSSNGTMTRICSQAVPSNSDIPPIPGPPSVKQTVTVQDQLNNQLLMPTVINSPSPATPQYQLELDWPNPQNLTSTTTLHPKTHNYPVVFLIQVRLFHDPDGSMDLAWERKSSSPGSKKSNANTKSSDLSSLFMNDHLFGQWTSLVWTTKFGAVLSDLIPGTWYQFRLLAISDQGYGGVSQPSLPIRIRIQPIPPSNPRNVTEIRSRIFENHVDTTISWDPPLQGNPPLKKYQIVWRRYYGFNGEDRSSFTEYEAKVPGVKTSYTIQNLNPGTSYKIEVRGISEFEGQELKGHPATLYIATIQIPSHSSDDIVIPYSSSNESCKCGLSRPDILKVSEQFLEDQELKALAHLDIQSGHVISQLSDPSIHKYLVEWTPRVCIETQNQTGQDYIGTRKQIVYGKEITQFLLTGLQFQCHYEVYVTVTGIGAKNLANKPSWTTCFCTPNCQNVLIRDSHPPKNCPSQVNSSFLQPVELTYTILPSKFHPNLRDLLGEELDGLPSLTRRPHRSELADSALTQTTYSALVKWRPLLDSKRLSRNLRARDSVYSSLGSARIRGVRVTWGPRLYEPVKFELYNNEIQPLLDPERTQSKVLEPHVSRLLLRGLEQETLYIVQAQMISDGADGPISTIFFATPKAKAINNGHLKPVTDPFVTLLVCLFICLLLRLNADT